MSSFCIERSGREDHHFYLSELVTWPRKSAMVACEFEKPPPGTAWNPFRYIWVFQSFSVSITSFFFFNCDICVLRICSANGNAATVGAQHSNPAALKYSSIFSFPIIELDENLPSPEGNALKIFFFFAYCLGSAHLAKLTATMDPSILLFQL